MTFLTNDTVTLKPEKTLFYGAFGRIIDVDVHDESLKKDIKWVAKVPLFPSDEVCKDGSICEIAMYDFLYPHNSSGFLDSFCQEKKFQNMPWMGWTEYIDTSTFESVCASKENKKIATALVLKKYKTDLAACVMDYKPFLQEEENEKKEENEQQYKIKKYTVGDAWEKMGEPDFQLAVCEKVALSLLQCHDFFICHGDPKLENILWDGEGFSAENVFLCDYNFLVRQGNESFYRSTLMYRAPEAKSSDQGANAELLSEEANEKEEEKKEKGEEKEKMLDNLACDLWGFGCCIQKLPETQDKGFEEEKKKWALQLKQINPSDRISARAFLDQLYMYKKQTQKKGEQQQKEKNRFVEWMDEHKQKTKSKYGGFELYWENRAVFEKRAAALNYVLKKAVAFNDFHPDTLLRFFDLVDMVFSRELDESVQDPDYYTRLMMVCLMISEKCNEVFVYSNDYWCSRVFPCLADIPKYSREGIYKDILFILKKIEPKYLVRSPSSWPDLWLYAVTLSFSNAENKNSTKRYENQGPAEMYKMCIHHYLDSFDEKKLLEKYPTREAMLENATVEKRLQLLAPFV